jgi:phage tail-like protein
MSVATARNFLLDVRAGWHAIALDGVEVGSDGALGLRPLPAAARPLATAGACDVAVGVDGRLYLLDSEANLVRRLDPCTGCLEPLPCLGGAGVAPRRLCHPRGLAISACGDLLIADTGNRRVQVFHLPSLALLAVWHQPGGDWEPWDVTAGPRRAYVADRANGLVHAFERGHRIWARDGADPGGKPLVAPIRLALDSEGRLLVAQEGRSDIVVLDADGRFLERVEAVAETFSPCAIGVDAAGRVLLVDDRTGAVHRYCRGPSGALAHAGRGARLEPATALAFGAGGEPVVVGRDGTVSALVTEAAYETDGVAIVGPLDSELHRCRWHRVMLRADVPAGTSVRVDTFTSEAERPPEHVIDLPDERWSGGIVDTDAGTPRWDCLVQGPPGRYLWLRLSFAAGGDRTPRVRDVEVQLPRDTSLRYLPAVYREDPLSASFLDRMLAMFDAIRDEIAGHVDDLARLLDPRGTPAEPAAAGGSDFLTWLASWVGLALERQWPVEQRRQLLAHAHRLFALRGTAAGLALHLRLYTGVEPRILEHYRLRRWLFLDAGRLGDAAVLYGRAVVGRLQLEEESRLGSFALVDVGDPQHDPLLVHAHRLTVFVLVPRCDAARLATIERIVRLAVPAHVRATVKPVEPGLRVGTHALLGIDSALGRYPADMRVGERRIGSDTVLDGRDRPPARVGVEARIGSTTVVE